MQESLSLSGYSKKGIHTITHIFVKLYILSKFIDHYVAIVLKASSYFHHSFLLRPCLNCTLQQGRKLMGGAVAEWS